MARSHDVFSSPRQRLARANEHIERLHKRIETFFKKAPYERVVELDVDGVTRLHKLKFTKRLPESCVHAATEALEALRSTLDQTGYAAAVASGKIAPKRTQFPIGDSPTGLENLINRKVAVDIPDEILVLFLSFKPYKGGNDLVWALNKLRNATHTTLISVSVISDGMLARAGYLSNASIPGSPKLDPEKNEIIFGRVGPGGAFKYDLQFSFLVALGELDVLARHQAVAVLREMSAEVRRIFVATREKCRQMGFC